MVFKTIKEMKKLFLLLTLMLLPLAISASEKIDGIYYNLDPNNKTATVVFHLRYYYKGDLVIPSSVTHEEIDYSVTRIESSAFRKSSELTSITIPNSVTSIGLGIFEECTSLSSIIIEEGNPNYDSRENCNAIIETASNTLLIGCKESTIPNSVTTIGKDAFNGCTSLTSITIPNSVTTIGESAFFGCSGLSSLAIGNGVTTIGRDAFKDCTNITKVELDNNAIVSKDYDGTPYISDIFGEQVKEYVFGEHVTRIGENAFSHYNLTSVTIPASVTNIGYCAFYQCFYLTDIHITDIAAWCRIQRESSSNGYYMNPFQVPYHLYLNDEEIKDLVIPDGVEVIGYSAFSGCSALTSVSIPNSVTNIGEDAFAGCVGLTSVTLGNNVASIGHKAFSGCSGLTSITIPASVTNIGYSAFANCIGLTSVHISDLGAWCKIEGAGSGSNPLEYAHHLYLNGEEIKNLVIPDGVTSIGSYAFSGGSELTSVTIPNSVTTIGDCAFYMSSSLTAIDIPDGVTSIGYEAFAYCRELASITVPNSVTSIGSGAFYGTTWYSNQPDGMVYVGNIAYKYKGTMPDDTSIVINDGTCGISGSAFAGCTGLISVTIPNSVTKIGNEAFRGCSGLTAITIPDGVTNISWYAFYDCTRLASVTIPYGVTSIESHAFYNCSSLTSIILPNSLTYIEIGAFNKCSSLATIVIPNSVITIDAFAFSGNMNLTDVYCYAEKLQLEGDVFGYGYYSNATLHVPEGSLDVYRSAEWWMYFGSIVALTDDDPKPTGIQGVNSNVIPVGHYYSLDGKQTTIPQRGINIIRMSDGTTKKVVFK